MDPGSVTVIFSGPKDSLHWEKAEEGFGDTEGTLFINLCSLRRVEVKLTQSRCPWPQSASELTDFILKGCCLALNVGLLLSFNIHLTLI